MHCCLAASLPDPQPSSLDCHSAPLISSFCNKIEVSRLEEGPPEWYKYVSVSGSTDTVWCQLLLFISLGAAAGTWKNTLLSMRCSETVNTLRSSNSADLGRYHWILEHVSLTQHFTVNENKVGSNDLWFSRYGKSLYVNIPISLITYYLTDLPWCCRSYYLCSHLNLQDPYSSFCSTSFMSWCWESQTSTIKVYQDSFRNHSYGMNIYKDIMIKIVKIEWVDYSEMLVIMCSW